jgi:multiple sugar transport system permease protein
VSAAEQPQTQAAAAMASEDMRAVRRRALRRQRINNGFTYGVGIIIALWIILPLFLIASMALTTPETVRSYPKGVLPFIPFSFETLEFFLNSYGVARGLINSVLAATFTVLLSTLVAAPAGYAISRYFFRGRDAFRMGILATRAFPFVVAVVPLAVAFIRFGLYDTVHGLALIYTAGALPTSVLIIGSVFASIPYEMEEAAMVFGATPLQAFRRVLLPLALPGFVAAGAFAFVGAWNEVFLAAMLTTTNRTLPARVLTTDAELPYTFAGGFFMLVPSVLFMFIIRRHLLSMWGQFSK